MKTIYLRNAARALAAALLLGGVPLFAQEAPQNTTGSTSSSDTVYERYTRDMTPPRTIYHPDPEYADRPRKKKIQGIVIVTVTVTAEGTTRDPEITKSLDKDLDKQAIASVAKWKFQPATKDGKPVSVRVPIEINFRLY